MLFKLFVLILSISFACNTVIGMELEADSLEGDQETIQVSCLIEKLESLSLQLEDYKEQQGLTTKKKRRNTKSKKQKDLVNQMLHKVIEFFESNKELFQKNSDSMPKICEVFAKLKNHASTFTGKVDAPFNLEELINDLACAAKVINAHTDDELSKNFDDGSQERGDGFGLEVEQVFTGGSMRQDKQLLDSLDACNEQLQTIVQQNQAFITQGGLDDYFRVLIAVFAIAATAFAIYFKANLTY